MREYSKKIFMKKYNLFAYAINAINTILIKL